MDGGGEGGFLENKAGVVGGRVGRDRKERIEGEASEGRAARHLASLPPSSSASAPPFVKNRIPSPLPVDGWWRIGGECTGRKNIWLRFGVLWGGKERERGEGAEIPCVNGNVCAH